MIPGVTTNCSTLANGLHSTGITPLPRYYAVAATAYVSYTCPGININGFPRSSNTIHTYHHLGVPSNPACRPEPVILYGLS